MYNDAGFTARIRQLVAEETDISAEAICVNCSHAIMPRPLVSFAVAANGMELTWHLPRVKPRRR